MLHKVLKLHPLISVGFLAYIFLCSGLIVNFLQLLVFVFVRSFSEKWGTYLNGHLHAALLSIFTFVVEWHCECRVRFFCELADLKHMNQEHTLCICNHSGEVDWLMGYTLLERINGLTGCKGLIKQEAKYLPVVGWLMWFSDYLFVSRSWKKDQSTIAKTCKVWAGYLPLHSPNYYVLYAEGTRFTAAKHAASVKFCSERGIEPFQHVLYPRTKGAIEVISQLGGSLGSVQNVVYAFPGSNTPTIKTMLAGQSTDIDIYFRRIGADEVPSTDPAEISEFIVQQYRTKDELLDYHKTHGKFPGPTVPLPRKIRSLVIFYIWALVTVIPGNGFMVWLMVNECYKMLALITLVYVIGGVVANKIISAAVMSKASSYGTSTTGKPDSNSKSTGA